MPLKPEYKAAIVKELRTTKKKQTTKIMRDNHNGYCALGIICEAVRKTTRKGTWRKDRDGEWRFYYDGDGGSYVLPHALRQELGLPIDEADAIFTLNDRKDKSFAEIADFIEREL